jgi:hypothetical protein
VRINPKERKNSMSWKTRRKDKQDKKKKEYKPPFSQKNRNVPLTNQCSQSGPQIVDITKRKRVSFFHCGKQGHYTRHCPKKAKIIKLQGGYTKRRHLAYTRIKSTMRCGNLELQSLEKLSWC